MKIPEQEARLAKQLRTYLGTSSPVASAINRVRKQCHRCFLFGGSVRDILYPDSESPAVRDLDFVVSDDDIKRLKSEYRTYVLGTNRFGGLRLNIQGVPVDVWAVEKTWAFRQSFVPLSFYTLTQTTFLNIDGIVADLKAGDSVGIKIFAKDFLSAFSTRVLDIKLQYNPYPSLVALKALRAAYKYNLHISYPLASYIHSTLAEYDFAFLEKEQERHYHRIVFSHRELSILRTRLDEYLRRSEPGVAFAPNDQLTFELILGAGAARHVPRTQRENESSINARMGMRRLSCKTNARLQVSAMEKNLSRNDSTTFLDRRHGKFEIAQRANGRWQLCCFVSGATLCVPDPKGGNKEFETPDECVALFKNPTSTDDHWAGFLNKIKRVLKGGEPELEMPEWLCDAELEKLGYVASWSPDNSTP